MRIVKMIKRPITSVSAVGLVSALCLNLPIQTAGQFVLGVIVPIPPHTPNIMSICCKSYILDQNVELLI